MKKKRLLAGLAFVLLAAALVVPNLPIAQVFANAYDGLFATSTDSTVVINEVESSDANDGADWVELYNYGDEAVDVSGWYILDDDSSHTAQPLTEGTTIEAGGLLVLEDGTDFDFGLGKADTVTLYDSDGNVIDSYSWTSHADGTYQRVPDGTGDFVDAEPTKGTLNCTIAINEIESKDADGGNDWVELYNYGDGAVDVSGWYILDNDSSHTATLIADSTTIEAGGVLVLEENTNFDFGLGGEDSVLLYNADGILVDSYSWTSHADGTYQRVPDGIGDFVDAEPTKGALNSTANDDSDDGADSDEETDEDGTTDDSAATANTFVINEINSSPDDWVEFMNIGDETIDVSGWEFRDNSDDHRWQFPEGTTVEAGALYVVDSDDVGLIYDTNDTYVEGTLETAFGIGSADSIRLYDADGNLVDEYSWTKHASYDGDAALASYGRYPDGTGSYCLMKETKGKPNEWYAPEVVINEVESSGDDTDWVEIVNIGDEAVDISGWYLLDNDDTHISDVTPVAEDTTLEAGEYYVFEQNVDFTFGLGGEDSARVYNSDDVLIDSYSWTEHASGVYARIPDGTGNFVDYATSTKGEANLSLSEVVLNEIESYDEEGGYDWIELANPTDETIDISGLVISNANGDSYTIPEGTTIEANGFLVIYADTFGFDLGESDSVYIYDGEYEIASVSWTEHADPTLGLYPDVDGSEYRSTDDSTPGEANYFADIPETIEWPGTDDVTVYDTTETFYEDSSGLDFFDGQLYAIDNGTGTFWILDMDEDWNLSFASGYENGKRIRFQADADDSSAAGPDAEGISVDEDGNVYIASERDNSDKGVNYDTILMLTDEQLDSNDTDLVAYKEWDITNSLPEVSANMGVESIEWVSFDDMDGLLYDQNTSSAFDSSNYATNADGSSPITEGVVFVGLEDNGHVYGYVLYEDGTFTQVADIDSKLDECMGLDYDTYEDKLWVTADNGLDNISAVVTFNGTEDPDIVDVLPAAGVTTTDNNEGFAIADASCTVDGLRPVFRFCDGVKSGALTINYLYCDYVAASDETVSALQELCDEASALSEADYTEESWNNLQAELESAAALLGDDYIDETDTTEQIASLQAAIDALIEAGTTATVDITRLYGSDRYATMRAIVSEAYAGETSDYVVVASGEVFADALSAASLAGALDAPILLVGSDDASAAVEAVQELEPETGLAGVYVVGGESTIPDGVAGEVAAAAGLDTFTRVAGGGRQDTSREVASTVLELAGDDAPTTAIVASGTSFADALSASPYSYACCAPIYLAESDGTVSAETLSAIEEAGYTSILVVGGRASVTSDAYEDLCGTGASVERFSGDSRYETSAAFAEWCVENAGMSYDGCAVAYGGNFPDALAGATICGRSGSVLLLCDGSTVAGVNAGDAEEGWYGCFADAASSVSQVYLLGGAGSVTGDSLGTVENVFDDLGIEVVYAEVNASSEE